MSDAESLQKMKDLYEKYRRAWYESLECADWRKMLEDTKGKMAIKSVLCLSFGGLQNEGLLENDRYTQLAALMMVVDDLRKSSDIHCTAQHKGLTHVETQFLEALGFAVFNYPEGYDSINANTLVYAVGVFDWRVAISYSPRVLIAYDTKILPPKNRDLLSDFSKVELPIYRDQEPYNPEDDKPNDWVCVYIRQET